MERVNRPDFRDLRPAQALSWSVVRGAVDGADGLGECPHPGRGLRCLDCDQDGLVGHGRPTGRHQFLPTTKFLWRSRKSYLFL